jgi:hypothetical protein
VKLVATVNCRYALEMWTADETNKIELVKRQESLCDVTRVETLEGSYKLTTLRAEFYTKMLKDMNTPREWRKIAPKRVFKCMSGNRRET